ncbi:MAG: hypothetical protein NT098_01910 [Candidatus Parcubacteria bacterium]|nr:hypothetical protein [Candidatus Parcubacteria bacterium]
MKSLNDKVSHNEKTSEHSFHERFEKKKKFRLSKSSNDSLEVRAKKFLESGSAVTQTTKIALALVVLAGAMTIFCAMPGLTIMAGKFRRSQYYSKKQLANATQNLKRRGYVKTSSGSGKSRIVLTEKGKAHFEKMLFEDVRLSKMDKWDEKWRVVLYDIPVNYTKAREALRWRLRALGFFQYQKSVWIYPYPCKDEILFLADYFGVGRFVEVLEVTGLSEDRGLKKHFELP